MNLKWIKDEWASSEYQEEKLKNFTMIDNVLLSKPMSILDIGCGLAWESRFFNQKYGSKLWLIDGDVSDNSKKDKHASEVNWHSSADEFLFYHPLTELDTELKQLGTNNYTLIDCNNIDIPKDVKFDIVTSYLSCGFHYPVSTYRELILKHSHPGTRIFMDLRILHKKTNSVTLEDGVEVVNIINKGRKHFLAEIKFVEL